MTHVPALERHHELLAFAREQADRIAEAWLKSAQGLTTGDEFTAITRQAITDLDHYKRVLGLSSELSAHQVEIVEEGGEHRCIPSRR